MESAISTIQKDVATALRAIQAPGVGAPPPGLPPALIPNQRGVSFVELEAIEDVVGRRPTQLRLPDGVVLSVRGWQAVLRECCKFVLSNNPALPIPFPDFRRMTVELIRTLKPPPTHMFAEAPYNGQTVYIYTTYDPNSCVRNARYIPKEVTLRADAVSAAVTLA